MTSNPIKGPSSSDPMKGLGDEIKPSTSRFRKVEKVEKIADVDPEQQSRARKFRAFMEEEVADETDPNLLSPMDLFENKEGAKTSSLPRSNHFWSDVDDPSHEAADPKLKEASSRREPNSQDEELLLSSHLGIPIKKPLSDAQIGQEEDMAKMDRDIGSASPMGRFLTRDEEKGTEVGELSEEMKSKKKQPAPPSWEEEKGIVWSLPKEFEDRGGKENKKRGTDMEIESPAAKSLPASVVPFAANAAMAASASLKPETISLFYQMVGTIHIMTKPSGVSETEIILNAPSYAQSKFYGASITIQKYASAPDSFNIQLTGSNIAVEAFKQNISSLLSSFQKGNFNFRIGRIEAHYQNEKPIFQRKQRKGEDDSDSHLKDKER